MSNTVLNPWDSSFYIQDEIKHSIEPASISVEEAHDQIEALLSKKALTEEDYLMFLEIIDSVDVNSIEHHGVKGMRWGVRHDKEPGREKILSNIKSGQVEEDRGFAAAHMIITGKHGNKDNKKILNEYQDKYQTANKNTMIAENNFHKAFRALNKAAIKKGVQPQYVPTLTKEELKTLDLDALMYKKNRAYKECVKTQEDRYSIIMEGAEKIVPTISNHQQKKYSESSVVKRDHRNAVIKAVGTTAAVGIAANIIGFGLAKTVNHSETGGDTMTDKPIGVLYQECGEGEADVEHTYYQKVICGNCSEPIGTTLQEKLREEVTQCPNCKCILDYQDDKINHHGISNTVQKIEGGSQVAHKGLNPWDSSFYDEIEHYGVKGMKWGVRKERRRAEHTFHENYVNAYNRSKQDYITANKGKGKTIREVNKDFVQKELQSKHDFVKANKGKGKTIEEVNNEYMKSVIDRYPPKERVPSKRDLKYQKKKKEQDIQTNIDKISSMSPKEADEFIAQLKRMNTATRLNEERLRAVSQTQLAEIQLQKAKLETINTGLSGIKTSMEVATKVSRTKVAKKAAQELGKRSSKKGS